jgi:hypothetical protein
VRAVLTAVGMALLATGTVLIGYVFFADMTGVASDRTARPWARPWLLTPFAMGLIVAGGLVLRDR